MSVQITSCPASAKQAPVTKPTYPQPITDRRKRISLVIENHGARSARRGIFFSFFKNSPSHIGRIAIAAERPLTVRASPVKSTAAGGEERSKAAVSNGRGEFHPAIHGSLHLANPQDKSNAS